MGRKRRFVAAILAAVLLTLGLGYYLYYYKPGPLRLNSLRVYEPAREVANLPHYAAAALGYFEDQGLSVSLTTSDATLDKVLRNTGIAILAPDQAWENNLQAFACLAQSEPGFLLAREPIPSFTWGALKGKTIIGTAPDSTLEVAFEAALRSQELGPQIHVTVVQNLPDNLRLGTFLSGGGDFIILSDPEAHALEMAGDGHVVASLAESGHIPARICAATPQVIKRDAGKLQAYARALADAQEWIAGANPREIAAVVAPFFPHLDLDTLTLIVERQKEHELWASTPAIDTAHYERLQEMMVKAGEQLEPIPFNQAVRGDIVEKALKAPEEAETP